MEHRHRDAVPDWYRHSAIRVTIALSFLAFGGGVAVGWIIHG